MQKFYPLGDNYPFSPLPPYIGADQVPLVTELPLTSQAYRVIDSYGAHGITNQDFCMRKGLTLDYYANRALAKSLIKQSKVFAITSDSSNIRTVV